MTIFLVKLSRSVMTVTHEYPDTGGGPNAGKLKSNRDCKEGYAAARRRETSTFP